MERLVTCITTEPNQESQGRGRIWTKCDKLEGRLADERETTELSGLARSIEEHRMKIVSDRAG